jgi:hypothetical protein
MGGGKENMDFKDEEKESKKKNMKRKEGGSCGGDGEWKRRKRKRIKVKRGNQGRSIKMEYKEGDNNEENEKASS